MSLDPQRQATPCRLANDALSQTKSGAAEMPASGLAASEAVAGLQPASGCWGRAAWQASPRGTEESPQQCDMQQRWCGVPLSVAAVFILACMLRHAVAQEAPTCMPSVLQPGQALECTDRHPHALSIPRHTHT